MPRGAEELSREIQYARPEHDREIQAGANDVYKAEPADARHPRVPEEGEAGRSTGETALLLLCPTIRLPATTNFPVPRERFASQAERG